jgi:hypothetical protein
VKELVWVETGVGECRTTQIWETWPKCLSGIYIWKREQAFISVVQPRTKDKYGQIPVFVMCSPICLTTLSTPLSTSNFSVTPLSSSTVSVMHYTPLPTSACHFIPLNSLKKKRGKKEKTKSLSKRRK